MSIDIEATSPLVISGTPDIVYPYVFIEDLNINTRFGQSIQAMAFFRYYRIDENGNRFEAPLSLGRPMLLISNLNEVLGQVEGGTSLKDGVEQAFIMLGQAQGVI